MLSNLEYVGACVNITSKHILKGDGMRPRNWIDQPDAKELFLLSVEQGDGCWLWSGSRDKNGYGRVTIRGRSVAASRVAYELFVGAIPAGTLVMHRCDTPACVKPDHLCTGTPAENMRDRVFKGRVGRIHSPYVSKGRVHRPPNWASLPNARDIFLLSVNKLPAGCWEWMGARNGSGHGLARFNGVGTTTHRIAYHLFVGPIPDGAHVLHRCDNPPCVNPEHLYVGDHARNMRDATERGRWQTGDRHWTKRMPDRIARGDRHRSRTAPESLATGNEHWTHRMPERINTAGMRAALVRGERHGQAKITEADVRQMREMAAAGATVSTLATRFNLSPRQVRDILARRAWGHC